MENLSLQAFLESDREMLLANLEKDRAPEAAQAALERAIDRTLVRYVEQCSDPRQCAAAQGILEAVKATLPMLGAVNDTRVWKKTADTARRERRLPGKALALLFAGAVLVLASLIALLLGRTTLAPLGALRGFAPALAGSACLFFAGRASVRKPLPSEPGAADVRVDYLIDPQKTLHLLRAAMLVADTRLDALAEESAAQRRQPEGAPQSALPPEQVELLSGLLEIAYGRDDADAREMISAIRFYLHNAQVDVVDSDDDNEAWFEFLPSPRPGTLRPALVSGGKPLKKGLAAA